MKNPKIKQKSLCFVKKNIIYIKNKAFNYRLINLICKHYFTT